MKDVDKLQKLLNEMYAYGNKDWGGLKVIRSALSNLASAYGFKSWARNWSIGGKTGENLKSEITKLLNQIRSKLGTESATASRALSDALDQVQALSASRVNQQNSRFNYKDAVKQAKDNVSRIDAANTLSGMTLDQINQLGESTTINDIADTTKPLAEALEKTVSNS